MDVVEGPDLRRLRWKEGLAVVGKFSGGHEKSKDIFKDWAVRSIDSIVNKNKQIQIKAQAIKWKKKLWSQFCSTITLKSDTRLLVETLITVFNFVFDTMDLFLALFIFMQEKLCSQI